MNRLCKCGCGEIVQSKTAKYINGHNSRGVKRPKSIALKRKQTVQKKYGVDNVNQLESVKNRKKKTSLKNYGVESPNQSNIVKQKKKESYQEHYGVSHPLKTKEVKSKIANTCLKRYGVRNPNQYDEFQKKSIDTCIKKYGCKYSLQSSKIKKKIKQTLIEKYGVDNYSKTDEFRLLAREQIIHQKNIIVPRIGIHETKFLDELQKYTQYIIQRNPKIIGYFPDGYIEELSMVIEFDEKHHNYAWCRKKDLIKDKDYKKSNLKIFRVREKDWKKNSDLVINDFINLINGRN